MLKRRVHPQRRASRSVRGLAALCALMLVTSNALAAMGLCIAKVPVASTTVAAAAAEQSPCPQHVVDDSAGALPEQPSASPHCPQDDPGAQVRSGDVPAADLPIIVAQPRAPLAHATSARRGAATVDDSPHTPLYARLSRLLL
jgi:hypothetical protein